jgi:hypothetical protein
MLVKTDQPGYLKDTSTGAIINNDDEAYRRFQAVREASKKNSDLCKRIDSVEGDLKDIKNLLLQIVHRTN